MNSWQLEHDLAFGAYSTEISTICLGWQEADVFRQKAIDRKKVSKRDLVFVSALWGIFPYLFYFETGSPTSCTSAMPPRKRPATTKGASEKEPEEIPPNQLALEKNSEPAESEGEHKAEEGEKEKVETPKPEKKKKTKTKQAAKETQKKPAGKSKPVKKTKVKNKPGREAICPSFAQNPCPNIFPSKNTRITSSLVRCQRKSKSKGKDKDSQRACTGLEANWEKFSCSTRRRSGRRRRREQKRWPCGCSRKKRFWKSTQVFKDDAGRINPWRYQKAVWGGQ